MALQTYNFKEHKKGDTFKGIGFIYEREILNELGVVVSTEPVDLTDAIIKMQLKRNNKPETVVEKTFTTEDGSIIITDAPAGEFAIAKQIVNVAAFTYQYDIQATFLNGDVETPISGTWPITQDITT